ncbi:hypothetical protein, partial [uncultured Corynebacterium sp.]|uniref:hypothetical protein n=1 Tax=uncultured Corynebacterium sp. TaxID=159447 RepID=UPI002889B6CC
AAPYRRLAALFLNQAAPYQNQATPYQNQATPYRNRRCRPPDSRNVCIDFFGAAFPQVRI